MAFANAEKSTSIGTAGRFGPFVQGFREYLRRRRVYAQTFRELDALSVRDLTDLGMSRADIERVAHEAAWGK